MFLTEHTKEWLLYCHFRHSVTTYKTYRSAMSSFLNTLPPQVGLSDIRASHIESFVQQVAETHRIKTANTYLAAVKSFFTWAESYYQTKNVAAPVTKLRGPKPRIRVLTEDEYRAILNVVHGPAHDAVQFLANTGLRRDEFKSLRRSCFMDDYVHITGKGSKDRLVPLNDICKSILESTNGDEIPSFVQPFQPHAAFYKLCEKVSAQAHIPYFTPHAFRHFFATRLIRAGVPLVIVSKILGHSNTQITESVYVHLVPQDLRVTGVLTY